MSTSAVLTSAALQLDGVSKSYPDEGGGSRPVLRGVSLELAPARSLAIVGRSGSGKSTLLHLAAGIDTADAGTIRIAGQSLGALSESDRTSLRRDSIGLIFQFFQLLPHLSVAENVAMPQWIAGRRPSEYAARANELLERVGLAGRERQNVQTLSGGEMQRVAICRALLMRPAVLLADEPTGNLDDDTGQQVMDLLFSLTREEGSALVFVTHSRELAARADELRVLHDGQLELA